MCSIPNDRRPYLCSLPNNWLVQHHSQSLRLGGWSCAGAPGNGVGDHTIAHSLAVLRSCSLQSPEEGSGAHGLAPPTNGQERG
jgi:hypothetical protein